MTRLPASFVSVERHFHDSRNLVQMLLRAPPMVSTRSVTTISLRSHLLLLVAATLPLGALTTMLLLSADARQPEWLIASAALLVIALGLAVTVARRITDVAAAVTSAARAIGLGEAPVLGSFPIRELDELARAVASAGHSRRETETRLRAAEARLAATLEAAPAAIMCIDSYRRVLVFNRAAETMFACPATQAIGVTVDRFFSQRFLRVIEAHLEPARDRWRALPEGGADNPVGFRGDGTEFMLEAGISRVDARAARRHRRQAPRERARRAVPP
jgi:PAS domain S-box-containing protein